MSKRVQLIFFVIHILILLYLWDTFIVNADSWDAFFMGGWLVGGMIFSMIILLLKLVRRITIKTVLIIHGISLVVLNTAFYILIFDGTDIIDSLIMISPILLVSFIVHIFIYILEGMISQDLSASD